MDRKFDCIIGNLSEIQISIKVLSNDEHVEDIERLNRTVKERVRKVYNTIPFKKIPNIMIIELVDKVIFCINDLPHSPSVRGDLRPRQIVTSLTFNYNKHCHLQLRKYAQVHEYHGNTMQECSKGSIVLRPTRNSQGK